jgi:phosphoadenosine phosphosulfate reductase
VPLRKALKNAILDHRLRAEQSENRNDLALFEYDAHLKLSNSILLKWTLQEVEDYLRKIMYHTKCITQKRVCKHWLCARKAITADEDIRAGRWWESVIKNVGCTKSNFKL